MATRRRAQTYDETPPDLASIGLMRTFNRTPRCSRRTSPRGAGISLRTRSAVVTSEPAPQLRPTRSSERVTRQSPYKQTSDYESDRSPLKRRRAEYTEEEDLAIIDYLVSNDLLE